MYHNNQHDQHGILSPYIPCHYNSTSPSVLGGTTSAMPPTSSASPLEGSTGSHHWHSSALEEASNGYGSHGDMVAAAAAAAAAVAANGGSRYGYNMADVAAAASTGGSSRYGYNAAAAVAAAAHRESSAAYFSSAAAAASLNPYAAAAYAQNMMNSWNGYSIAAYQGLQREGVTFGI